MKINKKELKDMVMEVLTEMELSESDIIAKDKSEWKEMKGEFGNTVKNLLDSIEDDNYSDASGDIEKTMKILRTWKKRIAKSLTDSSRG